MSPKTHFDRLLRLVRTELNIKLNVELVLAQVNNIFQLNIEPNIEVEKYVQIKIIVSTLMFHYTIEVLYLCLGKTAMLIINVELLKNI